MGFPYSSGDVLTAADMNAIGSWQDYTPTLTNLSVGNGTLFADYAQVNELVFWRVQLIFGSTTSISGNVSIDFPTPADLTHFGAIGGQCYFDDATGADYVGGLVRVNTSKASVSAFNTSSTYLSASTADIVDATTPFTWTTNDRLVIEDWYKPA